MARYAMVFDGPTRYVANVMEWSGNEADWAPPAGFTMILDEPPSASPGFTYDGTFVPPPTGGMVEKETAA